jgi:Ecdysteroid kinase-like family
MESEQAVTFPWMNKDYFKLILSKIEGQHNFQLLDFIVDVGTNKGENYASAIYRVTLKYLLSNNPKETVIIVKTSPSSSALSELLEDLGTFEAETNVYKNILTQCEELLPNSNIAPK